ncbi:hypothetical protein CRYUN_Cryun38cG0021100 [Craigia yunnanensis]
MATASFNNIERAHQMFREGRYEEALGYYTEALAVAKTKPQKIALHVSKKVDFVFFAQGKALVPIPESEAELEEEEDDDKKEDIVVPAVRKDLNAAELNGDLVKAEMIAPEKPEVKEFPGQETDYKNVPERNPGVAAPQVPNDKDSKGCQAIPETKGHSGQNNVPQRIGVAAPLQQGIKDSKGWQAIPKPKGHSTLDYARWNRVEDDSSEDDDDNNDEESQPQYRYRVSTVGMQPVKWNGMK